MTESTPDLDALVEAARIAEAQRRSTDAATAEVLRLLAEAEGGAMPLDGLLAAGAPRDVVAHLVAEDQGDKRRKQKARLGFVAGVPVVWMTSTGYQAVGRSSAKEVLPSAGSVAHATAPAVLSTWLKQRNGALAAEGITVRCTYAAACRRWSTEVTAKAWAALRTHGDADGAIGSCTGGVIPDALIYESFPQGARGRELHARLRGSDVPDDDDLAETTYAVEIEDTRKSQEGLRIKVLRAETVCEKLGAARAVLWVVRTREVANRLRDLGVDSDRRPSQVLVPASEVGLGGEDLGPIHRPWYMTKVPPDVTD